MNGSLHKMPNTAYESRVPNTKNTIIWVWKCTQTRVEQDEVEGSKSAGSKYFLPLAPLAL